jgi:Fe-S cluster biogenesis protein NfuA
MKHLLPVAVVLACSLAVAGACKGCSAVAGTTQQHRQGTLSAEVQLHQ